MTEADGFITKRNLNMKRKLGFFVLALMLVSMLSGCGLTVPRPEIKNGEFDFLVTYEYKGETKTVSGVYVCKYAGTSWALDGGSHRDWEGYIKGGEIEEQTVLDTYEDGDELILVIELAPEYFMGDYYEELYGKPVPYVMIADYTDYGDYEGLGFIHEPEAVEAICGARIISYEYDEPIVNTFTSLFS